MYPGSRVWMEVGESGQDALGSMQVTLDNEAAYAESFLCGYSLDTHLFLFVKEDQHSLVVSGPGALSNTQSLASSLFNRGRSGCSHCQWMV
jgi:hypothetical protein